MFETERSGGWRGRVAGLPRRVRFGAALAGIALTAAACGSSATSSTPPASGGDTTTSSAATSVTVKTASVDGATALVDAAGYTLYTYSLDKPGKIACTGGCAQVWHPLLVPAGDHLAMSMGGLGTEVRPGGAVQVTYKGSPLYTYTGDTGPHQHNGASIPDWAIADVSSGSSGTTSSTSSGGYGY